MVVIGGDSYDGVGLCVMHRRSQELVATVLAKRECFILIEILVLTFNLIRLTTQFYHNIPPPLDVLMLFLTYSNIVVSLAGPPFQQAKWIPPQTDTSFGRAAYLPPRSCHWAGSQPVTEYVGHQKTSMWEDPTCPSTG